MLDVHERFLLRNLYATANCLNDSQVCLMGHKPVDIFNREVIAFHYGKRRREHIAHGVFINHASFLIDIMLAGINGLVRGRERGAARLHEQIVESASINVEFAVDHTKILICGFYQNSRSRVSEERTGCPILIIGHAAHFLSAYHNHFFIKSGFDICPCCLHGHNEACAGCLNVVCIGIGQTEFMSDDRGG